MQQDIETASCAMKRIANTIEKLAKALDERVSQVIEFGSIGLALGVCNKVKEQLAEMSVTLTEIQQSQLSKTEMDRTVREANEGVESAKKAAREYAQKAAQDAQRKLKEQSQLHQKALQDQEKRLRHELDPARDSGWRFGLNFVPFASWRQWLDFERTDTANTHAQALDSIHEQHEAILHERASEETALQEQNNVVRLTNDRVRDREDVIPDYDKRLSEMARDHLNQVDTSTQQLNAPEEANRDLTEQVRHLQSKIFDTESINAELQSEVAEAASQLEVSDIEAQNLQLKVFGIESINAKLESEADEAACNSETLRLEKQSLAMSLELSEARFLNEMTILQGDLDAKNRRIESLREKVATQAAALQLERQETMLTPTSAKRPADAVIDTTRRVRRRMSPPRELRYASPPLSSAMTPTIMTGQSTTVQPSIVQPTAVQSTAVQSIELQSPDVSDITAGITASSRPTVLANNNVTAQPIGSQTVQEKADQLFASFHMDEQITEIDLDVIKGQILDLFDGKKADFDSISRSIDKYIVGDFKRATHETKPCLFAKLKMANGGEPGPESSRSKCPHCRKTSETQRFCGWAEHADINLATGYPPRVNGIIKGNQNSWDNTQTPWTVNIDGRDVRWILKKRKLS